MSRKLFLIAVLTAIAAPVLAHHPLGGAPMTTFVHGVLSGVGHPVLGFDHLFFVLAVGIAAVFTGRAWLAPLFFIGGMLAGVGIIMAGVQLPLVEWVIAASLITLGGIVLTGRALNLTVAAVLFASLGLFHGWAFGESLVGQESVIAAVVTGYLLGLALTQWALAVAAGYVVSNVWRAVSAADVRARLAGAVVAGVGAAFFLEGVEGVAFAALGF